MNEASNQSHWKGQIRPTPRGEPIEFPYDALRPFYGIWVDRKLIFFITDRRKRKLGYSCYLPTFHHLSCKASLPNLESTRDLLDLKPTEPHRFCRRHVLWVWARPSHSQCWHQRLHVLPRNCNEKVVDIYCDVPIVLIIGTILALHPPDVRFTCLMKSHSLACSNPLKIPHSFISESTPVRRALNKAI